LTCDYTMCLSSCVPPEDYKAALEAASREYEELTRQRRDLDARIAQLAQSIGTLARLCGYVPTVPWGLTDAVRMVLKAAGHPLTALEVRAQLEAMGVDLSRYASDLAVIHTVLKRLNESDEAGFVAGGWGRPRYEWKGAPSETAGGIVNLEALKGEPRRAVAVARKPPARRAGKKRR
jgi:hypothetical protein